MLDFAEALAHVLDDLPPPAQERVPLVDALGRVLAQDIRAVRPLPAFDYSAMDGYALRTADLSEQLTLPVARISSAGSAPAALEPGTAMRIFTGGPIPEGADAVVMQENVEHDAGAIRLLVRPSAGTHIRRRGEDLAAGASALRRGQRLNAFQLGLAAALDQAELVVAKRPEVSIVCTGDELRLPGSAPTPGSVPESNGVALGALVRGAGGSVHLCPSTSDDREQTLSALRNALDTGQVAISVGGVSVGDRDIVRETLESLGVSTSFHKVAIKPGKPLYFGKRGNQRVLGLPGNPASAQITFALFGVPLLRALLGVVDPLPARTRARLTSPVRQRPGRTGFLRAKLTGSEVTPLDNQASGASTGLAWANALAIVPSEIATLEAGSEVEVIPFHEL